MPQAKPMIEASVLELGDPEREAVADRLQTAAKIAWEATRRRETRWVLEDLGRYHVAVRAKRKPGVPGFWLELLVTSRFPLSRAEAEALAKLAGVKRPILDEFPGNQIFVEEASWSRYAASA